MCLFCDIVSGKVPGQKIYEDDLVYSFEDKYPQAKKHILIVPKKHIESLDTIEDKDMEIIAHIFRVAKKIASMQDISKSGFRTVFNCNSEGAQSVYHLHLHMMGGEQLGINMSGL